MLKEIFVTGGLFAVGYVSYRIAKAKLGTEVAAVETTVTTDAKAAETTVAKDATQVLNGVEKKL